MGERTNYGKLKSVIEAPDLIEIQLRSYSEFLQVGVNPLRRKRQGLQSVFKEVFPIDSYDGRYVLDFQKYELSDPKLSPEESLYEGQTYSAPLHVTFSLKDGEEVREENVYMGEVPLMTANGSFVVNGAERVVVSQLHRSPGICSEQTTPLKDIYHISCVRAIRRRRRMRGSLLRGCFSIRALRSGAGGPLQDQPEARSEGKVDDDLRVLDKLDVMEAIRHLIASARAKRRRRHRPSRQPACAHGRRACWRTSAGWAWPARSG
jgi:hypothetical protein